jgi:ionotropic kainate glutamate receptor 2
VQNVNITGFRLVDPGSLQARQFMKKFPSRARGRAHPLYSANALIYDAVQVRHFWHRTPTPLSPKVLAKALSDLDSLQDIRPEPLGCDSTDTWADGHLVLGYLREVEHTGLTGEIRFDTSGFRTSFQLDLMEKVRGRVQKTATWSPGRGVNYTLSVEEEGSRMVEKLANKTLRVVTTPNSPYVMEMEFEGLEMTPEAKERLSFLERYEGFCVDLIKELSKEVGAAYLNLVLHQ